MPYRFHVVALPHTHTNSEYCMCAYTMKIWNFCRMMMSLGHEVYHYGGNESRVECTEHITVVTHEEQDLLIGPHDNRVELCQIEWDANKPYWQLMNARAAVEIIKRHKPNDFLCIIGGTSNKPLADMLTGKLIPVEYGIGYTGTFSPYRVFESYAHMHRMVGTTGMDPDVRWYDAVIPNYFDPAMFPFHDQKEDYLLYAGRLIKRKGVDIAAHVAESAGMRLIVGGSGVAEYEPGRIVCLDGTEMKAKGLTYAGVMNTERRAQLMSRARAVIMPTVYFEPFGGVAVEAMMCGTPVIACNFGAFPETVEHGKTGFRCNTMDHFVWAAKNASMLTDFEYIRDRAVAKYSIWNVRHMYQEYFDMVSDLVSRDGWYTVRDRVDKLDWLSQPQLGSGYAP